MPSILIADHHHLVRRGLAAMLAQRPYVEIVAEAEDGAEALERARATKPDIALVELSLPELNGIDLTSAIRSELPKTKVMIFSTHARDDLILAACDAGATGYVLKGDAESELLSAVDALTIGASYYSKSLGSSVVERCMKRIDTSRPQLTAREREVLALVAQGLINKQIAHALAISAKTVETHRASIMQKLELRTTADLVRYALRNHISAA